MKKATKIFSVNLACMIFALLLCPNLALADAENSDFHTIDLGYNKNIYGVRQIEAIKNWGLNTQTSGCCVGVSANVIKILCESIRILATLLPKIQIM